MAGASIGMLSVRDFSMSSPVPCRDGRDPLRLGGDAIATPRDVQVRTQKYQIVAVDVSRGAVRNVERIERYSAERPLEARSVRPRPAQTQERIARADPVLDRRVALEPYMRQ